MNQRGFGMIADYVPPAQLDRMRRFVAQAIDEAGQRYVGFVGRDAVAGSAFAELAETAAFRDLMRRVYDRAVGDRGVADGGAGRPAPEADFYQVLRCLAGETGKAHALIFHYDSYVVTALIPVEIPSRGNTGDLVMLPNWRRIRRSYLANLIDKVLLDNRLTQAALRLAHRTRLLRLTRIRMTPGNIYFFWGYRSIHANEACDPAQVRATAIYHYANPHAHSALGAAVRRLLPR
jgi:hypothetical protein